MDTLVGTSGLKPCVITQQLASAAIPVVDATAAEAVTVTPSVTTSVNQHAHTTTPPRLSALNEPNGAENPTQEADLSAEDLSAQSDVSMLAVVSEDVTLASGQQVIHQLNIHCLDDPMPENGDSPEVIIVYQDIFTCGACSKQFVDMVEFLEHKTHHTIGSVFHKCDLCQMVFRTHSLITDHYQKLHRVNFSPGEQRSEQGFSVGMIDHNSSGQTTVAGCGGGGGSEMTLAEKNGAVTNLDLVDGLQCSVDKVLINGELAVGMVNSELCTTPHDPRDTDSADVGAGEATTSEHVVFVHNGIPPAAIDPRVAEQRVRQMGLVGQPATPAAAAAGVKTSEVSAPSTTATSAISIIKTSSGCTLLSPAREAVSDSGLPPTIGKRRDTAAAAQEVLGAAAANTAPDSGGGDEGGGGGGTEAVVDSTRPDFNFILQTEMIKGSTFTYGKTWFKCLHCEFKTNAKVAITKHMQEGHADLLGLHPDMEMREVNGNDRRKVMKMSTYETIFGRESRYRRRAKKSKRAEKQDLPGVYNCTTCGKVFTRMRYLRKHQETHRTEKKYLCDECGKSFKSRTYLSVHRRVHKEKLFRCNQCDFKSKINAAIHAHRQVHSQGSVLCDICGYAYTDKSTLNKHKRVHDLNRPFKCNFPGCTWRFKTEVMCKAHIRAHTTEGKFKCSFCGYLFRHKHHLQRHETSMHGVRHTKTRTNNMSGSTAAPAVGGDGGAVGNPGRVRRKRPVPPPPAAPPSSSTSPLDPTTASAVTSVDTAGTTAVSLVISGDAIDGGGGDGGGGGSGDGEGNSPLQLTTDGASQHLVVATDEQGTPIAFEGGDLTALSVAYQTLLHTQPDGPPDTQRTLIMTQPDTHIVYK